MFVIRKDSCLAWMVCFGALLSQIANIGVDNSFGVVIGNVIKELNSTTYHVSWIQSTHSTCMFLFASISSFLLKKVKMRLVVLLGTVLCCTSYIVSAYMKTYMALFLAYGVIGGIGSGLIVAPSFIACAIYFDKWKEVATGIASSGAGFGTMFVSLLCSYININYGYTGYFLTLSLIASLNIILFSFASPLEEEKDNCSEKNLLNEELYHEQEVKYESLGFQLEGRFSSITEVSEKSRSYSSLCSNFSTKEIEVEKSSVNKEHSAISLLFEKRMVCYCFVHIFFELAYYLPMVFLPETMITDHSISKSLAGTIISVLGVSNTIGKLLTGSILQCFKICPIIFSAISLMLLCISTACMTLCVAYAHFVIVAAIYGLVLASIDTCSPFIIMKILGEDKLKDGFGLIMCSKMFCPLWGPPIGGALKDWFGFYNPAFYAASGFFFISFSFNALVFIFNMNHNRYNRMK